MKIEVQVALSLKIPEVQKKLEQATREGLRDTIVAIHETAIDLSHKKTGHNARSIASEVSGMGVVEKGSDAEPEHVVDDSKLESACYSTSGYGGYLEVGTDPHIITVKTAKVLTDGEDFFGKSVQHPGTDPYPYFRPALDMHKDKLTPNIKKHLEA